MDRPQRGRSSPAFSGTKASLHPEGSEMDRARGAVKSSALGCQPWERASGWGTWGAVASLAPV